MADADRIPPAAGSDISRTARGRIAAAEAGHRRGVERIKLGVTFLIILAVAGMCLFILTWPESKENTERIKWAQTTLTTIVTVGIGYALGHNGKGD